LFVSYALGWALNHHRAYSAAALLTSVAPSATLFCLHIATHQVGEPLFETLNVYGMTLLLLPWVLMGLDQKSALAAAVVINFAAVVLVEPASGWIEIDFDPAPLRSELVRWASLLTSAAIIIGAMLTLRRSESTVEQQNAELMSAMQEREHTMLEQAAQMNLTIDKLKEKEQVEAQQVWLNEGLIGLGGLQQQHTESAQLAERTLAYLVKRVKADQAGLFLVRTVAEVPHLYLSASYAYERKKFLEKKIELGEGLVGQTYLENETTVISRLPEGYSPIASSLGQAPPRQLVLVPLRTGQQSFGVLEMASFSPLAPYQIEFLERAAQSLATAVQGTQVSEQTRHLLQQAQQQTEELRAREEEMQQNLEELTATQEDMRRLSFMSKQIFDAASALVGYVELAMNRQVLVANSKFAKALGYEPHELTGQPHQSLAPNIPAQEYEAFWADLLHGKSVEGLINRRAKNGRLVPFQATYRPVLNGQGKVEKIIKFAYEVPRALAAA
jgi:PAS domain S-box-containing protein